MKKKQLHVPDVTAQVWSNIVKYCPPGRTARFVVGASGGADSTALALALSETRQDIQPILAHLHHGLRGAEADADLSFVRRLSRKLGLRFVSGRADVAARARRSGVSLEMAARDARRAFLLRTAQRWHADAVVLGHTADDQAETVLLRLARGAALRGLGGMAPVSHIGSVPLLRPMLDVNRTDIETWLTARGQDWREDASNHNPVHRRNRVRHTLIPWLERNLNPRIREALNRAARAWRDDEALLSRLSDRFRARSLTETGDLRRRPLARAPEALRRRILRDWLYARGFDERVVTEDLIARAALQLEARESIILPAADGWFFQPDPVHDVLRLVRRPGRVRSCPRFRTRQPIPGSVGLPAVVFQAEARLARGYRRTCPPGAGRLPAEAWVCRKRALDADLVWRCWRAGDRIRPLGMTGSRKLQDIFTEAKVPAGERRRWPILTCGREVVWVPGYRIARDWAAATPAAPTVHLRLIRPDTPLSNAPLKAPAARVHKTGRRADRRSQSVRSIP